MAKPLVRAVTRPTYRTATQAASTDVHREITRALHAIEAAKAAAAPWPKFAPLDFAAAELPVRALQDQLAEAMSGKKSKPRVVPPPPPAATERPLAGQRLGARMGTFTEARALPKEPTTDARRPDPTPKEAPTDARKSDPMLAKARALLKEPPSNARSASMGAIMGTFTEAQREAWHSEMQGIAQRLLTERYGDVDLSNIDKAVIIADLTATGIVTAAAVRKAIGNAKRMST